MHVAGVHLRDFKSGEYNLKWVHEAMGRRLSMVINFARWELGLAVAFRNPLKHSRLRGSGKATSQDCELGTRLALIAAIVLSANFSLAAQGGESPSDARLRINGKIDQRWSWAC
jgi:hypothetical protein